MVEAGKPLTEASDWYSVGVILYEVLTGRFPIGGRTTMQILRRKQSDTPVHPERWASDSPQHLNELCVALLQCEPQNRPAAADVLRSIGADIEADQAEARQQAARSRKVEHVGRERHFEVLLFGKEKRLVREV